MIQPTTAPAKAASLPIDHQIRALWDASFAWIANHSLQIIIGAAIGTVIVLLLLGVRLLGIRICRSDSDHTHWRTTIGRALSKTRLWFMIAIAAHLVAGYAHAPEAIASTIRFIFVVAAALQCAIWARELILGVIEHRAGGDMEHGRLGSAMGIIRLLVTIAIFAIAIILILDNLGVNVTGLVAGLGIGGIAIGLAAQGIFSDLFAALSIIFDKPFRKGDGVKWDTTSGSVEEIGLKTTRVRSLSGEQVVISNANLLNKELRNFSRLEHRRMVHVIGVTYQTPPETLKRIPGMVRDIVQTHAKCAFIRCGMTGFADSSLNFELQFDIHSTDYEEVFDTNHMILIEIYARFNEEGIEFAYPTQTSFTAAPDGKFVLPYPPVAMVATEPDGNIRVAD